MRVCEFKSRSDCSNRHGHHEVAQIWHAGPGRARACRVGGKLTAVGPEMKQEMGSRWKHESLGGRSVTMCDLLVTYDLGWGLELLLQRQGGGGGTNGDHIRRK